jgi:hypothetical protein
MANWESAPDIFGIVFLFKTETGNLHNMVCNEGGSGRHRHLFSLMR